MTTLNRPKILSLLTTLTDTELTSILLDHDISFPKFWDTRKVLEILINNDSLDCPEELRLSKTAFNKFLIECLPNKPFKLSIVRYLELVLSNSFDDYLKETQIILCTVYLVYFKELRIYKVGRTSKSVKKRLQGYPDYTILLEVPVTYLNSFILEKTWLTELSLFKLDEPFNFPFSGYTECFRLPNECKHSEVIYHLKNLNGLGSDISH